MDKCNTSDRMGQFISLLTANQHSIYAFILSRVPRATDADDLMQETSAAMWMKFDDFEIGTDFLAWGIQIAQYNILNFRRKSKHQEIYLSDEVLVALDRVSEQRSSSQIDELRDRLRSCIGQLPQNLHDLLIWRYGKEIPVRTIAGRIGRSASYVYSTLAKVHQALLVCMQRAAWRAENK